mmetsp:Transcript_41226/g.109099  ORF Transcript_41226/g.109099 Transcript_41226/m.109099 type:complete len:213 (+) Transcript_41226:1491-2129(+)
MLYLPHARLHGRKQFSLLLNGRQKLLHTQRLQLLRTAEERPSSMVLPITPPHLTTTVQERTQGLDIVLLHEEESVLLALGGLEARPFLCALFRRQRPQLGKFRFALFKVFLLHFSQSCLHKSHLQTGLIVCGDCRVQVFKRCATLSKRCSSEFSLGLMNKSMATLNGRTQLLVGAPLRERSPQTGLGPRPACRCKITSKALVLLQKLFSLAL